MSATISADALKAAVNAHWRWLAGEDGGACADLSGANLSSADGEALEYIV